MVMVIYDKMKNSYTPVDINSLKEPLMFSINASKMNIFNTLMLSVEAIFIVYIYHS